MLFWVLLTLTTFFIVNQVLAVQTTTVYYHRCLTHQSLRLNPVVEEFFRWVGWLTMGLDRYVYAGVHKLHHHFTDIEGDPHSPYIEGFWPIQIGNVFYYRVAAKHPEKWEQFVMHIKRDFVDYKIFSHALLGPTLGTVMLCSVLGLIWGVPGILCGLVAAGGHLVAYVFVESPSVNGLCHYPHPTGYQHTKARQAVTTFNNLLVALITGGEGLHHNHHWIQASARFAVKWYEKLVDTGWWTICVLKSLGLATNVRVTNPVTA